MSAEKIIADWKQKKFKPVYWLEGEEPFFIDEVVNYAEHKILNESEAAFNLTVFYGKDADWPSVVNACMGYPMFGERKVVVLKEAQQMKDIEKLENYISKPLASTVFVVSYKEKKLDARTKFSKAVKQHGELLSTKKIYENQLPEWTQQAAAGLGLSINQNALLLLVDHIGNDLSRMKNELEKISINLHQRKTITEDDIEKFVGVSKEFNVFELQDAISQKNLPKAIRIIQYFQSNPKAAPLQLVLPTLYNYFSKIYMAAALNDYSENALKPLFYNNPFAARQALTAVKNYGFSGAEKIILLLHEYNLKGIGINSAISGSAADGEFLKELAAKIIMAA
ncbi:DNA polymerase III subunit delta [Parafilimonas sp.]|jgi:DNA polymerase-3 subunit delta|uniref:DNA polymerase III subunit delta n=1 Tax=Parafilimonas sp. TaxID=1969739 RepID=UPI003F7E2075